MKHLLIRLFDKMGLLVHLNILFHRKIKGKIFFIPIIKGMGRDFLYADKEPWMDQLLVRLQLNQDSTFLDVGANIGQTLIRFRSIYPHNPYAGCEPNPLCTGYLDKIIYHNRLINCTLHTIGLSDTSGWAKLLRYNNDWDSAATIIQGFRRTSLMQDLEVKIIRGDELVTQQHLENIVLIKIDVEGGELEVLTGLSETIREQRPVIICEILPVYNIKNSMRIQRQQKVVELIHNFRYSIFRIIKDSKNEFKNLLMIENIEVHGDLSCSDYVFVPREKDINMILS